MLLKIDYTAWKNFSYIFFSKDFLFICFFEAGHSCIDLADFELAVKLQPQPSNFQDYRCALPWLAFKRFLIVE